MSVSVETMQAMILPRGVLMVVLSPITLAAQHLATRQQNALAQANWG